MVDGSIKINLNIARDERRERIATAVLAGFAVNYYKTTISLKNTVSNAISIADELIRQLDGKDNECLEIEDEKRCPVCGDKPSLRTAYLVGQAPVYQVHCPTCYLAGPTNLEKNEAWLQWKRLVYKKG